MRGFNPCLIAELSATPVQSNILVDITGRELHREEMIKLDLHVVNKASPDWKDTLLAGVNKRNVLEEKAREYEANTGIYIRPICLIQVERTGKEQQGGRWIHSEQVREHLIKNMGVPAEEIAVKTSEKDELKEVDDVGGLLSRDCKVRYIITKQALQEGWDCAFAYVLVILTNPSSKNALTQLVGRILRQPYARKTQVLNLTKATSFVSSSEGKNCWRASRRFRAGRPRRFARACLCEDEQATLHGRGRKGFLRFGPSSKKRRAGRFCRSSWSGTAAGGGRSTTRWILPLGFRGMRSISSR